MPAKVRMVKGPATVAVEGTCHVLGSDVSGKRIRIRVGKALPFEPAENCRLRVRLGRGSRMWRAESEEAGVSMWHGVAKQVSALGSKKATVMIVGDTDTGKSTLSVYLANVTLSRGLATCTVDGDIGQGDLAPPASIGAAALSEPLTDLRDAGAGLYEFVGITSPAGFEQIVAGKLKSILERARPLGDICIVNTDGYVRGRGVQYKQMLARELQPDAIICLENPELLDAFKGGPWQVIHARASSQVSKTKYERKNRRLDQFLRHIGSGLSDADLSQVKFVHMDRVFSQPDLSRPAIIQLEPENMKRMFVGLGKDGQVVGFGLVVGIADDRIFVRTDVESFDSIYLSDIRLGKGRIVEIRIA